MTTPAASGALLVALGVASQLVVALVVYWIARHLLARAQPRILGYAPPYGA